ncbi:Glycolipid 2-alpha-mannosyltransferase (alpha-1,2-mannosyltransferase) [Phaffia rhodozyma]|uniref:Glycolipid 2-alpha-mannosyltransferase (Alpha-1,2-mannosyltransferase) n=1 Tax=Phaffia rhodozyma TaxID=264483 RepID=A0A0F7SES6_PHARH|nr:Glycolipid 2-alpha-mannosyltransferase (alpha-1,2-mannosyltransferase) [Phaffia rhodozyma]
MTSNPEQSHAISSFSLLLFLALCTFCYLSPLEPPRYPESSARPILALDIPVPGCSNASYELTLPREKACILILAGNQDDVGLKSSLESFERMFNAQFRYPYVLLSDTQITDEFLTSIKEILHPDAVVESGLISHEQGWGVPDWMDSEAVQEALKMQKKQGVQHGGEESYHNTYRFYSGPFAVHPLLAKYEWYWRLESDVGFFCKLNYDPFRFMATNSKVYGFNIAMVEQENTIPTLFETVSAYRDNLISTGAIKPNSYWSMFEADGRGKHGDGGKPLKNGNSGYNLCQYWTNFEIGSLNFFRSKQYQELFHHLDQTGNFYFERWGDASIRSLALGLFTNFTQTHYFEDIAYTHHSWMYCPTRGGIGCDCSCPPKVKNIALDESKSCLSRWQDINRAL